MFWGRECAKPWSGREQGLLREQRDVWSGWSRESECLGAGGGGRIKGPAKTHPCWVGNPLYSGSNEKPLEGSKNEFLW